MSRSSRPTPRRARAREGDGQRAHAGGRARPRLPRQGEADHRLRRVRRDLPGHRRPDPHQPPRRGARREGHRRGERGRRGAREVHRHRPLGPDPALAQGGAGGRARAQKRPRPAADVAGAAARAPVSGAHRAHAGRARTCRCPRARRAGAAGFDLHAASSASWCSRRASARSCRPASRSRCPTGYEAQVRPRSGLALRHGHRAARTRPVRSTPTTGASSR